MPFLPPNQQRQSTEGKKQQTKTLKTVVYPQFSGDGSEIAKIIQ